MMMYIFACNYLLCKNKRQEFIIIEESYYEHLVSLDCTSRLTLKWNYTGIPGLPKIKCGSINIPYVKVCKFPLDNITLIDLSPAIM